MKRRTIMIKLLISILTLCIMISALCSFNQSNQTQNQNISEATNSKLSGRQAPPQHSCYDFDSYRDIVRALTKKNSKKYSILREEQYDCGTVYQNTLSKFANGDIKVAIPQIDNKAMPIENKEGMSKITLMTKELYDLPWVWYHCVVNNQEVTVRISYLDAVYYVENSQNTTYLQILKSIAPDAPSPENYQNFESYKTIYEKNIVLKDGVTVTAMISEVKDSSKEYVKFYYDGLLIVLDGDSEFFSDEFFNSFSIGYVSNFNWVTIGVIIGIVPVAVWGVLYLSRRRKAKINESLV